MGMTGEIVRATPAVAEAVRAQYAAKASGAEMEVLAAAARHLQLSIPAGEIAMVPYGSVNNIQITLEGRRTIAQRTGRLHGISPVEWCGPRRFDADGAKLPLEWEEVWTGDGPPYAARVFVVVEGWDRPANGTCKYDEFNQPTSPVWKKYPSHMLGNAAEKLALRRGFSAEIGKALADLADITGDYRIADEDTGEISPAAPGPERSSEPRQDLASASPGPQFATADPDGGRKYSESPFRQRPPLPVPPPAAETPPGRPTIPRPPAAPNPATSWSSGEPMFDPVTGKPL